MVRLRTKPKQLKGQTEGIEFGKEIAVVIRFGPKPFGYSEFCLVPITLIRTRLDRIQERVLERPNNFNVVIG